MLQKGLEWLNDWEKDCKENLISEDRFLTRETASDLRITILSTLEMCTYLISKYEFKYLLTGHVNQDNLEV